MAETIYNKYKNTYDYTNENLDTKNIKFLSGLQEDLNKYFLGSGETEEGNAIEGAFYLTSDTHRLYIGRSIQVDNATKTVPIPVNEGIQSVSNASALSSIDAHAGEFYYAEQENILCIYNGTEWVQINPDTDTNDTIKVKNVIISSAETVTGTYKKASSSYNNSTTYYTCDGTGFTQVATSQASDINNYYIKENNAGTTLIYTLTLQQLKQDKTGSNYSSGLQPADIISYLVIPVSDLAAAAKAGITSSAVTTPSSGVTSTTISLNGDLADNTQTLTIKGEKGVTISGGGVTGSTNNDITITGKTYGLSRNATTAGSTSISLTDTTSGSASTVSGATITVNAGDNLELDTSASANQITLNHSAPGAAVNQYTLTQDTTVQNGKTYYLNNTGTEVTPTTGANPKALGYYEQTTYYGNNTAGTIGEGGSIKVPKIEKDSKGHIASITDVDLVLPTAVQVSAVTADNTGKITITKSNTNTVQSGAVLYNSITVDGHQSNVYNQGNLGSFYSANQVDALINDGLKSLNALTYKGTVGTLPSSNVAVGDTYLVDSQTSTILINGTSTPVKPGDLIVAKGNEYTETTDTSVNVNKIYYQRSGEGTQASPYVYTRVTPAEGANPQTAGYYENTGIIQGTITWDVISVGNTDTKYDLGFNSSDGTVSLKEGTSTKGSFTIVGGDKITRAVNVSGSSETITLNHDVSGLISSGDSDYVVIGPSTTSNGQDIIDTSSVTLTSSGNFTVPVFKADKYGHLVSAGSKTYTLPESNNISYFLRNASTYNGTTYGTDVTLYGNTSTVSTLSINGDSFDPTADTSVNINKVYYEITSGTGTATSPYVYTRVTNPTAANLGSYYESTGGVSVVADSSIANKLYIKHAQITQANVTETASNLSTSSNSFNIVSSIGVDSFGHVTGISTKQYTLPSYSLVGSNSVTTNGNKKSVSNQFKEGTSVLNTINYRSETLTLGATTSGNTTTYDIDMTWGSF